MKNEKAEPKKPETLQLKKTANDTTALQVAKNEMNADFRSLS